MDLSKIVEFAHLLRVPLAYWFIIISVAAIVLTVYDKSASWKRGRRVPERVLLLCAFFGGALFMYVSMQIMRHKTQHASFMIPLPLFILLHLFAAWFVYIY